MIRALRNPMLTFDSETGAAYAWYASMRRPGQGGARLAATSPCRAPKAAANGGPYGWPRTPGRTGTHRARHGIRTRRRRYRTTAVTTRRIAAATTASPLAATSKRLIGQGDTPLPDERRQHGCRATLVYHDRNMDGARVQVHRAGPEMAVFTRTLDDITARVPEVVVAALALPVRAAVLDGEVIALHPDGRPHPFQVTASRVGSRLDVERLAASLPLTAFLFDLLHLDGQDLLDRTGAERHAALAAVVPEPLRMPRTVTADPAEAAAFLDDTLARGHEGVMVKSLAATWEAGRRGAGWLKVKPVHTLDLVVLAVEWGHGRRRGWLSNLHLGARDPDGGFVMLGKTFKGLTDKLLTWQTERLLELEVARDAYTVHVRPELVVEIAFDGLQTSPRYPGGLALRFARVLRYRPDKRPEEADTIETVRTLHTP